MVLAMNTKIQRFRDLSKIKAQESEIGRNREAQDHHDAHLMYFIFGYQKGIGYLCSKVQLI